MSADFSASLSSVFLRALSSLSSPHSPASTQQSLLSAISDLQLLSSRVDDLALFSDNETVDDLGTKDAVYMLVDYVWGEAVGRVRTEGREERMTRLRESERHFRTFLDRVQSYGLVGEANKALFDKPIPPDFALRREVKIKQFKAEKELRARIASLLPGAAGDYELFSKLVELPSQYEEDKAREAVFCSLRLGWILALGQMRSVAEEMELLRNAPSEQSQPPGNDREWEDRSWRLDKINQVLTDVNGPLLDPQGRPLRPFTLMPSNTSSVAADRQRLQAQVFRPSHRLPTMSIDEFLAEEQRRGNLLSGGGAASENAPTSSEQMQLGTEMDGTAFADERAEEQRRKDENWAVWTESNPKGSGNRGNKG
ncbi:TAP42-like protein [Dacryopinax primogenitus]|uniref:TAP42-like protein n=1 Tax=Dacryopinax primogenitus (strain DJM 731) TaxID=1858805 RepID=M5GE78_DACPD|nr:TAP42-like protein [Dacryopinax primogenitus]EJU05152.1 TAP42-like protein [Dacryopinax primogenitus]